MRHFPRIVDPVTATGGTRKILGLAAVAGAVSPAAFEDDPARPLASSRYSSSNHGHGADTSPGGSNAIPARRRRAYGSPASNDHPSGIVSRQPNPPSADPLSRRSFSATVIFTMMRKGRISVATSDTDAPSANLAKQRLRCHQFQEALSRPIRGFARRVRSRELAPYA